MKNVCSDLFYETFDDDFSSVQNRCSKTKKPKLGMSYPLHCNLRVVSLLVIKKSLLLSQFGGAVNKFRSKGHCLFSIHVHEAEGIEAHLIPSRSSPTLVLTCV